jgi:hypothetical protein
MMEYGDAVSEYLQEYLVRTCELSLQTQGTRPYFAFTGAQTSRTPSWRPDTAAVQSRPGVGVSNAVKQRVQPLCLQRSHSPFG